MMRFGVIGTGRITRRLVVDLQSTNGVEVTAMASRDRQRARWYADQFGVKGAVGYDELFQRDDVDAVYIAVPPSLHRDLCCQAAENGKHILCEKPLAMDFGQAMEIANACQQAGVRWLDASGWLHHERTAAFADWIAKDRLGSIGHISAAVSFYRPFQSNEHRLDPKLGGGCLLDLAWYTCGLVRYATARMPTKVFASSVSESGVPMRVNGMLWFDQDVTASVSCGYDTATRKWFEIAGSKASLICDDFTRPWADRPARCWIHEASGAVQQEHFEGCQERAMIGTFADLETDLTSLQQQAIDTHQILDAISRSTVEQRVVEI